MGLFQLLHEAGLKNKEISEKLGLGLRSVQNYANGSQPIPESIQRLIRYAFADILPKELRLTVDLAYSDLNEVQQLQRRINDLEKLNQELKEDKEDLKRDKEMLQLHIQTLTKGSEQKKPV